MRYCPLISHFGYSLILLILRTQATAYDSNPFDDSLPSDPSCSRETMTSECGAGRLDLTAEEKSTSMAVVPYAEENILLPLNKPERTFEFAGKQIRIRQDWAGLGVAAVVWDAAIVLCQYLERNPDVVCSKSVLEIGAGTGLVGIVAALLGGMAVVTDREEVLDFLQETVDRNVDVNTVDIGVHALDWTKDNKKFNGQTFDVILGADVVYIEEVFEDLLKTLIQLSRQDTVILLSCRIRYDRDTDFLAMLAGQFSVEQILYDKATDVKLFKVMKL